MWERIGVIVLVSLCAFFRTLRLKFVSDDIIASQTDKIPKNLAQRLWWQLVGFKHFGTEEAHFITLILHTLVCVFVYLGLGKSDVSFLAALLFCINPVNSQGSVWISGRFPYVIPALLLLISMAFHAIAPIFLILATRTATAFIAPLSFVGSFHWPLLWCMPVIWLLNANWFKKQVKAKFTNYSYSADRVIHPRKLILAVKTWAFYLLLAVVPFRLTFYHSFMQSGAGGGNEMMRKRAYALDGWFWGGLVAVLAWCWYARFHWGGIAWGVFWFSVCILPFLNIIRVQQEIAERYVYLANVGLMYALAGVILAHPIAQAVFFTFYATRLWYYIPAYTDEYWITEYAVAEDPGCWYAWHSRALKRFQAGSLHEALTMWVMAKMISPKEFKILLNIAIVLRMIGNIRESDFYIEEAKKNMVPGQEGMAKAVINDVQQRGIYEIKQ